MTAPAAPAATPTAGTSSITGTIRDADGTPIAGLLVRLYVNGNENKYASTDAQGGFAFQALSARTYTVGYPGSATWGATHWETSADSLDATPIVVDGTEAVSGIDLTLRPAASVSGTLIPSNSAQNNGTVTLYRFRDVPGVPNVFRPYSSKSSVSGSYRFDGVPPGIYRVGVSNTHQHLPTYFEGAATLETATDITVAPGDAITASINMRPTATVVGTVTSTDGLPVTGAAVSIYVPQDTGGYRQSLTTYTDGAGRYSARVAPSDIKVGFESKGFTAQFADGQPTLDAARVMAHGADSSTVVDAVLQQNGGVISGRLTGGGAPRGNIRVTLYEPAPDSDPDDPEWQERSRTYSTSQGDYAFADVPGGVYLIEFWDSNHVWAAQWWDGSTTFQNSTEIVLAEGGMRRGLDATLVRAGEISGTVSWPSSAGAGPVDVVAFQEDGDGGWVDVDDAAVSRGGTYRLRDLSPGTYRLGFFDRQFVLGQAFWQNAEDIEDATDIEVTAGAVASGRSISLTAMPELIATTRPSVSGVAAVGSQVTVNPGTWSAEDTWFFYQWLVDGEEIDGADRPTFTPRATDIGKSLSVEVYAFVPGYQVGYAEVAVPTKIGPSAPTALLTAKRTAQTATLTWSAPEGASSYRLEIKAGSTTVREVVTSDTTATVSGLDPSRGYTAEVVAVHAGGGVSAPGQLTFTTLAMGKPTKVRATKKTKSSITMAWTRPEGSTKFRITYWTGKSKKKTITVGNVSSKTITGLKKSTTYSVVVQAVAATGATATASTIKVKTASR